MHILSVAMGYPSDKEKYNNNFIHTRIKLYQRSGYNASMFLLSKKKNTSYVYDNVNVTCGNGHDLVELVNKSLDIMCVCFHFITPEMINAIKHFRENLGVIIFVHGNEALWWYERIFPDRLGDFVHVIKFARYIIRNSISMARIRKSIADISDRSYFVGVSRWMIDVAKKNWKLSPDTHTVIIPNIVDNELFSYKERTDEKRLNVLMIRSFTSGKYALDIAMEIIKEIQKYPEAKKIHITVYGDGWLYEKYTNRIKMFDNVELHKGLLSHEEMAEVFSQNGFFICPTRQDAQGVSMCEAMCSGLVPISSPNTAIPEFLPTEYNLMFDSPSDSAKRIIDLIHNPEEYRELSKSVSEFIVTKCSPNETTDKEIELMGTFASR